MKFSEMWLREWVNPLVDGITLLDQMTMAGLEVESIQSVGNTFNGVVVGEVIECSPHPNADKLFITKINIGENSLLSIVCGSPNCRKGLKVAVAKIGAILPNNYKIKAVKLRGEISEGMICSCSELGIADMHNDILELELSAPIGYDIRKYLKLEDNIIEIKVTSNRADCLSIIGVAREIAVINKMMLSEPDIKVINPIINETLPIHIDVPALCPRYLGRVVKGINIKAVIPFLMREKLHRCGMIYSHNPVINIINYILLELGQPIQAFDRDRIDGGIIVRMAKENETLTLFNGHEAILNKTTLVVSDHKKVLSMAGISVGKYSSVHECTRNIFLESAFFSSFSVTRSIPSSSSNLRTDASYRYERGIDPMLQYKALERATSLLIEICGGEAGPIIDISDLQELPYQNTIILHRKKLNQLIGYIIDDNEVNDILDRLGYKVKKLEDNWQLLAPSWRFDILIEEDVIGEIIRIYGYNNIPNVPLYAEIKMIPDRETHISIKHAKNLLVNKGYQEAITYSFVNPKIQTILHPITKSLMLLNPISIDMSVMRLSLWTGLLQAVVYNQHRQQSRVRLFESGLRFVPDKNAYLQVRQDIILAGVISGNRNEEHWDLKSNMVDFYDLKGDLESLLKLTGRSDAFRFLATENPALYPALHPGQSAEIILDNILIGCIGVVHPEVKRTLDLEGRVVIFELLWEKIANRCLPHLTEISRFPINRRDISIVVDERIPASNIIEECKKIIGNQLFNINLFDVYRGNSINNGFKSLAISLIFQDTDRIVEEKDIASSIAKCIEVLKERFQASLRN